ncbi:MULTISPECIES: hypothetical protein [Acidiphilium]|uniref:hypothetical protein n=1 Tax=Acidiphilium TaxID=522 RepID=UPI000493D970|nr:MULTISPECIES: hypothetical protein [Acidiphilium]MBW4036795.1 hypothetical protein [Pseudomonadota bacterium]
MVDLLLKTARRRNAHMGWQMCPQEGIAAPATNADQRLGKAALILAANHRNHLPRHVAAVQAFATIMRLRPAGLRRRGG